MRSSQSYMQSYLVLMSHGAGPHLVLMRLKQTGVLYSAGRPTLQGFGRRHMPHCENARPCDACQIFSFIYEGVFIDAVYEVASAALEEAEAEAGETDADMHEAEAADPVKGCSKCRYKGCRACRGPTRRPTSPSPRQTTMSTRISKRSQSSDELYELQDPSVNSLSKRRAWWLAKMPIFAVGQRVQARYLASQAKPSPGWYRGVVRCVHAQDGVRSYDVTYDDGDTEDHVVPKYMKALVC